MSNAVLLDGEGRHVGILIKGHPGIKESFGRPTQVERHPIAERIRKLGGTTLRSIGHIARNQRVLDNDETERRTWFLFEASCPGDSSGH